MNALQRFAGRHLRRSSNTLILAYHRITDLKLDPQLLCVSPHRFQEHLEVIKRDYEAARLNTLDPLLAGGGSSPRRLILTFDDGYADNLTEAVPLLEALDVPATIFVVTGVVGAKRFFYWDVLAQVFLAKQGLPDHLSLSVSGKDHLWHIEPGIGNELASLTTWTILSDADPLKRCAAYKQIVGLLKDQAARLRSELLEYVLRWADMSPAEMRPQYDTLSESDLGQLGRHPLIEIGSHTVSHPTMALLSRAEQMREIINSKQLLEEMIGHPVSSFSYPYGTKRDFTGVTARLARQAGFQVACANFEATIDRNTDRYILPRFLVRNWDGDEFQRRLAAWFERY